MGGIQRWAAGVAAGTLVSAGVLVAQAAAQPVSDAAIGNLTVYGKGFGHGRGMSQYGAQGAAIAGKSYNQILSFYYPGTTSTSIPAANRTIRVYITADTSPGLKVRAAQGLRVHDLRTHWKYTVWSGYTHAEIRPYGSSRTQLYGYSSSTGWRLIRTMAGMAQFEGAAVTPLVLPSGSSVPYRGTLRTADRNGTDLDTVNLLSMDYYLRGVVPKEALSTWRAAALQTQAVAARTYAYSKRGSHSDYDLCDTTACQMYSGYSAEVASTNSAIVATGNIYRAYGGKPIFAEFSASNGGYTAKGDFSYLGIKQDPYDDYPHNGNPYANWTKTISSSTAQAGFGVGTISAITVLKRNGYGTWGGRVLSVRVTGSAATKIFTGEQVRSILGLRSAWFRIVT